MFVITVLHPYGIRVDGASVSKTAGEGLKCHRGYLWWLKLAVVQQ